jgi:hypothetical protein
MPNRPKANKFKAMAVAFLGSAVFASVAWGVYIHLSYASSMPRVPQPDSGRTYALVVNHGTQVYVTRQEFVRANFAFHEVLGFALVCILALALIKQYWHE